MTAPPTAHAFFPSLGAQEEACSARCATLFSLPPLRGAGGSHMSTPIPSPFSLSSRTYKNNPPHDPLPSFAPVLMKPEDELNPFPLLTASGGAAGGFFFP